MRRRSSLDGGGSAAPDGDGFGLDAERLIQCIAEAETASTSPPGVDDVQPGDRPGDKDWTLVRFALPSDTGGGVRSGVVGACGGRGALLALDTVVEGSSGLDTSPPLTLTFGAGTLADVLNSGVDPAPLGTTSHRFPPDWADGALL